MKDERAQSMTDLSGKLEQLCRCYGVASLYAFGSRSGEITARVLGLEPVAGPETSDLDCAVQPQKGALKDATSRVGLMQELEDLFQVRRVDLVILPQANAFLAADAVRGELLYCDDEDRQAWEELYYLRRAADLAPYQKQRLEGILSGELRR